MSKPWASTSATPTATKLRIECRAQFRDQVGQRIGKIFVFAAPEPVAAHHNFAAKMLVVGIERGQRMAFCWREQAFQDGAALRVEIGARLGPVDRIDARGNAGRRRGTKD